ncbi:MAG: M24 family metallopeptidase, partial [Deltaproteobacteria bacterium]
LGFDAVAPLDSLEQRCAGLDLLTLASPDRDLTARAAALAGIELRFGDPERAGSPELLDAIITMRRRLDPDEQAEMRAAARVTAMAHRAAMAATRPGVHEQELAATFDAILAVNGMEPAYGSIVTVRGEILHNDRRVHTCAEGDLLLLDGGAEAPSGYATDVTRTWPVSGRFTPRQRAAYDAVLAAQQSAIDMVRPGVRYRHVHDRAATVLTRWLVDEGLLRGEVDSLVERGAHAIFFPHGVGHLVGLDVHDMENMGDRPAYPPGRTRSRQFGTAYLRLDIDLEPGNCVTIEPGFYVVPAILADESIVGPLRDVVDLDRARAWEGFGGIRIEDDVLCTDRDPEILTPGIPKDPAEIEAIVGSEAGPLGRFRVGSAPGAEGGGPVSTAS